MASKKWSEMDSRIRRVIVVGAVFDGVLKIAALVDIVRRPASEIRGSKLRWALVVLVSNSVGIVPITYFRRGRRR